MLWINYAYMADSAMQMKLDAGIARPGQIDE